MSTKKREREREREREMPDTRRRRRRRRRRRQQQQRRRVGDAMMTMTTTLTTLTTNPRAMIPPPREKRNHRTMTNQNRNQNETTTRKATTTTPKKKKKKPFLLRMTPRVATKGALLSLMACATITTHGTTQNFASAASSSYYGKQHLIDDRDENYIENIAGSVSSSEGDERKPTLTSKVRGKNKKKIERCTGQCVTTCVRGSFRSTSGPGLGPATILKEPFVFKDGFRSRRYCVEECLDYCALTVNKADVART